MKPGNDVAVAGLCLFAVCRSFAVLSPISSATTLRSFSGALLGPDRARVSAGALQESFLQNSPPLHATRSTVPGDVRQVRRRHVSRTGASREA